MSEGAFTIRKLIPIIVVTWILSLVTTLAIVAVAPSIFPVKTAHITDGAVTADKIAESAIITTKLADGTVTSAKILDGTIIAVDIADGSIISVKVANGSITTAKIADGAVTTDKIADGAVVTIKLADGSVTSAKILDGTVTAVDIADGSVTTSKIADGNITDVKLAAGAIPMWSKFGSGSSSITLTTWTNDTALSVNITLARSSDLLIMFSTEAWLSVTGDWIIVRALVGATDANPRATDNPVLLTSANVGSTNSALVTRIFHLTNVTAGTYTVQIQLRMWNGVATGTVHDRTLNIIAFPV